MSADRNLRLEVILQAVDRVTRPFRTMMGSSSELARKVKATRDQLKELERTEGLTGKLGALRGRVGETATALKLAQGRVRELGQAIQQTDQPSARMIRRMQSASQEVTKLTARQKTQK